MGLSITEIIVIGPFGLRFTQAQQVTGSSVTWYTNVTWTPSLSQVGGYLVCAVAMDSSPMTSRLSCFTVLVGLTPNIIANSTQPSGILQSSFLLGVNGTLTFTATFDKQILRPLSSSYIHVLSQNGTEIAKFDSSNSSQVKLTTNKTVSIAFSTYTFKPGSSYYIKFDQGVVWGGTFYSQYCNPQSPAYTSQLFWQFIVPVSLP